MLLTLLITARHQVDLQRTFSVVGPSVWNGPPLAQRFLPWVYSDTFYSSLKTVPFSHAGFGSTSE